MTFKSKTLDQLQPTMDATFHFMHTFGSNIFNLNHIPVNASNIEHVAILLRGLSSWKAVVNGFDECLKTCLKVCRANGIDEQSILFGMIPKDTLDILGERGSQIFNAALDRFMFEMISPTLLLEIEVTCNRMLLQYPNMTFDGEKISRFLAEVNLYNPHIIDIIPIGLDGNKIPSELHIG